MPQIVLTCSSPDELFRKNRGAALQRLSDSPCSNALLSLLAEWSGVKGAEQKIMKNKGLIKLKLGL